jgi:hypothetical protein
MLMLEVVMIFEAKDVVEYLEEIRDDMISVE